MLQRLRLQLLQVESRSLDFFHRVVVKVYEARDARQYIDGFWGICINFLGHIFWIPADFHLMAKFAFWESNLVYSLSFIFPPFGRFYLKIGAPKSVLTTDH